MSDNLFEMGIFFWFLGFGYSLLSLMVFWLPRSLRHSLARPLKKAFEEAIIRAYLSDGSDIGFFESFILGADRTREMVDDVYKILQIHQQANIKEKFCSPLPDKRLHDESQDILCGFVQEKKHHVVTILRHRDQIIPYLHKRLAVQRPILHGLLWLSYSLLER